MQTPKYFLAQLFPILNIILSLPSLLSLLTITLLMTDLSQYKISLIIPLPFFIYYIYLSPAHISLLPPYIYNTQDSSALMHLYTIL